MSKQKIAIISYNAIPYSDNWGSCQRTHYMANTLSEFYDVTVIAAKNLKEPIKMDCKQLYNTEFIENKLHNYVFRAQSNVSAVGARQQPKSIKTFILRCAVKGCKLINSLFYNEPTYFQGIVASRWVFVNLNNIVNYICRQNIEVVVISIPPWSIISLSLIKRIKSIGCKIIVDYRDPWNCWNNHGGFTFRKEKKIVQAANAIFTTNEAHADKISKDFGIPISKIHVVMNGYDEDSWNKIEACPKEEKLLAISFIGTIQFSSKDSFRNPEKFMRALENFKHKDEIKFRVIGCYNEEALNYYKDIIPHFEMIPIVSQKESFKWMMRSDILVNFHTTNDGSSLYLIAGKIFDYYRSGAKILSVNGQHSYEKYFVLDNDIGYYTPNDVDSIKTILLEMYQDWKTLGNSFRRPTDVDRTFSRQHQNRKVKDIIYLLLN